MGRRGHAVLSPVRMQPLSRFSFVTSCRPGGANNRFPSASNFVRVPPVTFLEVGFRPVFIAGIGRR